MTIPSVEDVLSGENNVFLSTTEGDQPRVRPVTLIENKGQFYILTGSNDAKIKQIAENAKVEVIKLVRYQNNVGYVRFSALAKIVQDPKIKEQLAKATSFFQKYWKTPKDPTFALIHLLPQKIEYLKPGQMIPDPIEKLDISS